MMELYMLWLIFGVRGMMIASLATPTAEERGESDE